MLKKHFTDTKLLKLVGFEPAFISGISTLFFTFSRLVILIQISLWETHFRHTHTPLSLQSSLSATKQHQKAIMEDPQNILKILF